MGIIKLLLSSLIISVVASNPLTKPDGSDSDVASLDWDWETMLERNQVTRFFTNLKEHLKDKSKSIKASSNSNDSYQPQWVGYGLTNAETENQLKPFNTIDAHVLKGWSLVREYLILVVLVAFAVILAALGILLARIFIVKRVVVGTKK